MKSPYLKAYIALAIPLITAILIGFTSGEWNYEEIGFLVGALVTGILTYAAPNAARRDAAPDTSRKDDLYRR